MAKTAKTQQFAVALEDACYREARQLGYTIYPAATVNVGLESKIHVYSCHKLEKDGSCYIVDRTQAFTWNGAKWRATTGTIVEQRKVDQKGNYKIL